MKTSISKSEPKTFTPFNLNILIETEQEYEILHRIFNQHLEGGSKIVNDRFAEHARIDPRSINIVTDKIYYALESSLHEEIQVNLDDLIDEKPPFGMGIMPYPLWIEHRTINLWCAIKRFKEYKVQSMDLSWTIEIKEHLQYLKKNLSEASFDSNGFTEIYNNIFG